jgi:hypothetical protein
LLVSGRTINLELASRPRRSVDYFLPYTRHNYSIGERQTQSFAIQTHGEVMSLYPRLHCHHFLLAIACDILRPYHAKLSVILTWRLGRTVAEIKSTDLALSASNLSVFTSCLPLFALSCRYTLCLVMSYFPVNFHK